MNQCMIFSNSDEIFCTVTFYHFKDEFYNLSDWTKYKFANEFHKHFGFIPNLALSANPTGFAGLVRVDGVSLFYISQQEILLLFS